MDVSPVGVPSSLLQRPAPSPLVALAPSQQSVQAGAVATAMQVAPGGRGEDLELRGRRRDDDTGGSGRGDERSESAFGDRYHFRLAHEPGLDRPLLQVVDRQTEEPMMSIPPKQLARMFAEVRAMLNGPLGGEAAPRRVDTAA